MSPRSVLVIDPDEESASLLQQVLHDAGAICRVAGDADAGWRLFAQQPTDVVVTTLASPRRDAAWLVRRLRDEYLGKPPPVFALADEGELTMGTRQLDLDGVILRPVAADALTALALNPPAEEPPARQAARLRDLFELSLLQGDLDAGIATFLERVALAFRAADCVLWGPAAADESRWPRSKRRHDEPAEQALLLWRCELALAAGATTIACDVGEGVLRSVVAGAPVRSYLGAILEGPGATAVGALCVVDDGARCYTPEERDALRALGRRLASELAWRSAHERLAGEHDRLRETALLDPLLGVSTRVALEEHLAAEIGRARRGAEPVTVAVLDVEQLRHINERYGHVAGDAVLAHLCTQVRAALRPQDHVGRLAGDELAVVLPGLGGRAASELLHEVAQAVASSPLHHEGIEIRVRVRVGAAALAAHEESSDALLARAVAAVGHAKRDGIPFHFAEARARERAITGVHDAISEVPIGDLLAAGTVLGGMYRILHEISRGAMGVVYRAEDLGLGRPVAVKLLRADLARDAELVQRFREEAAMLAKLHHENLVGVYTFGAQGDDVYFVMELVEGEPLSDLLVRADEAGEPLSLELVSSIIGQVASALDAMHRAGAVHRDVKPANILLDRVRDRAVLVDVGVAKARGSGGDSAGTPGFAAPESFTSGEQSAATDVYGLAATAYMMLTGLAPFGGGDVAKVVRRQLHDVPAPPRTLRGELAASVDRVILRGLAPAARDRYQGALEFAHALGAALHEAEGGIAAGSGPWPTQRPPLDPGATTRRRLLELLAEAQAGPNTLGSSRGALFRVAYKILGNRLGSGWVRRACETNPGLADVLRPTLAPLGWYPIERLVALLHSVPAQVRDPHKVARELGRASMTQTFARFFGADPASLSPREVLASADVFWTRYHTWGRVTADVEGEQAVVTLAETPRDPLICCLVEGTLERIAELAGASDVKARHVECETQGAPCCRFEVRWREEPLPS